MPKSGRTGQHLRGKLKADKGKIVPPVVAWGGSVEEERGPAMLKNLTHERFCKEYVRNGHNAAKAAIASGYSSKSAYNQGSRLLKREEITTRIHEIESDLLNELGITEASILERLNTLVSKCMDEEPVTVVDENGQEKVIGYRKLDPSGANKALELLGKQLGMFGDKMTADITQRMTESDRRLLENMTKRFERRDGDKT